MKTLKHKTLKHKTYTKLIYEPWLQAIMMLDDIKAGESYEKIKHSAMDREF